MSKKCYLSDGNWMAHGSSDHVDCGGNQYRIRPKNADTDSLFQLVMSWWLSWYSDGAPRRKWRCAMSPGIVVQIKMEDEWMDGKEINTYKRWTISFTYELVIKERFFWGNRDLFPYQLEEERRYNWGFVIIWFKFILSFLLLPNITSMSIKLQPKVQH